MSCKNRFVTFGTTRISNSFPISNCSPISTSIRTTIMNTCNCLAFWFSIAFHSEFGGQSTDTWSRTLIILSTVHPGFVFRIFVFFSRLVALLELINIEPKIATTNSIKLINWASKWYTSRILITHCKQTWMIVFHFIKHKQLMRYADQ